MKRIAQYILIVVAIVVLVVAFFVVQNKEGSSKIEVLRNVRGYVVGLTQEKDGISKNDNVKFTLTVTQNGSPANLFGKKIYPHATVVSKNLRDIAFYHVDDLEILENDVYEFEHQFAAGGEYSIWIELNDNTSIDHHGESSDYIAHTNVAVAGDAEDVAPVRLTSQDGEYHFQIILDDFNVGAPSVFRVRVTRQDGKEVKLIPNANHFYFVASPEHAHYMLSHPDLPLVKDNEAVISNVMFPAEGPHAFWIRLFPDDGSGEVRSHIQASFVLPKL